MKQHLTIRFLTFSRRVQVVYTDCLQSAAVSEYTDWTGCSRLDAMQQRLVAEKSGHIFLELIN
jgi:hypothetical protein